MNIFWFWFTYFFVAFLNLHPAMFEVNNIGFFFASLLFIIISLITIFYRLKLGLNIKFVFMFNFNNISFAFRW